MQSSPAHPLVTPIPLPVKRHPPANLGGCGCGSRPLCSPDSHPPSPHLRTPPSPHLPSRTNSSRPTGTPWMDELQAQDACSSFLCELSANGDVSVSVRFWLQGPPPPPSLLAASPSYTRARRFALIDPVRVVALRTRSSELSGIEPPLGGDVIKEGDVRRGGLGSLTSLSPTSQSPTLLRLELYIPID
ncbi:hypothetical protein R3P38DRAFT_3278134 [Favolaschia claudopus]|uniref:Uncharacterized protein n=1 Tax=Favolaschia claudopus TaxID=2862362 RepID=A0AAW0AML0_9AGAR